MINLEGQYTLPNWAITFIDPTITKIIASDNIGDKYCDVSVIIEVEGAKCNYGYSLGKFNYADTWEDADIENFVKTEMQKYKTT